MFRGTRYGDNSRYEVRDYPQSGRWHREVLAAFFFFLNAKTLGTIINNIKRFVRFG